ncbi:hypothetical protein [Burkholderia sp. Ac-20344]|uniref:hypothetical protein n=1 Tax=Burkholderia sp. Ac-20344 TaxID=2703890 RepID=UPI00197B1A97|nr:hypothetical protein [Burkholderia sp. Ac-20344]MBN3836070.1 hypothetical protein [Burkholderia sp. Ac-20344]
MSVNNSGRHPFLDDLTEDAILSSTLLRQPVSGRERIKSVIAAVGALYQTQTPTFLGVVESRTLLQYDAVLVDGIAIRGTAVIQRDEGGNVPRVSVTFEPLDAAMHLSRQLDSVLREDIGDGFFLPLRT